MEIDWEGELACALEKLDKLRKETKQLREKLLENEEEDFDLKN